MVRNLLVPRLMDAGPAGGDALPCRSPKAIHLLCRLVYKVKIHRAVTGHVLIQDVAELGRLLS